jgi:predicted site-specific integrase-resolvase
MVYLRVSSPAHRPDLNNQRKALEPFCSARGLTVDAWIADIGGGLNFKRPKFLKLVDGLRNYGKSLKEALASDGTRTQDTSEPDS